MILICFLLRHVGHFIGKYGQAMAPLGVMLGLRIADAIILFLEHARQIGVLGRKLTKHTHDGLLIGNQLSIFLVSETDLSFLPTLPRSPATWRSVL